MVPKIYRDLSALGKFRSKNLPHLITSNIQNLVKFDFKSDNPSEVTPTGATAFTQNTSSTLTEIEHCLKSEDQI